MDNLDLRHLRYFIAVAEELSITRAAERVRIAQPSLSVQIKHLEAQVGADLLDRGGRTIALTEAGRVFLTQARKVLAEANRSVDLARQAASGEIGSLAIGYNMPAAYRVFPNIVPAFRRKYPNVRLSFHGLYTPQQIDAVRRGEIDLGFVWLPFFKSDINVHELLKEPLIAVLPADHRLTAKSRLSISDLSEEPLVMASRRADPETYHQIEQIFLDAGAVMNVAYELENATSMIDFVAMGVGATLVPRNTCAIRADGVVCRPLKPPGLTKTLAMIKAGARSGLPQIFYDFALENLPDRKRSRAEDSAQ